MVQQPPPNEATRFGWPTLIIAAAVTAVLLWTAGCSSGTPAEAPTTIEPQTSESSVLANEPSDLSTNEGAPTDDPTDGPGLQPFEGGSYTWENGITMKTQVIRIEPWGETSDYCGDGSCGVSNPDDTRMVLRYTVSVPKSFKGTFDPANCPGDMHVANGNDDDSFVSVAGDYNKPLTGKMLPGATKYGDSEYSIEKKAINQTFYIESSCGDPDYTGELGYFGGPIPKNAR